MREQWTGCLAIAHIAGLTADEEIFPRRREEINYFGVFS